MPTRLMMLVILLAATSCRAPTPPVSSEDIPPAENTSEKQGKMIMQGINLYMHRRSAGEGIPDKPELWVSADTFSIEGDHVYAFENARAVIYGAEAADEIVIEANRGRFEQDRAAMLEGDVRMTAGTLQMALSDIVWTPTTPDVPGVAKTDSPVVVDDPELRLRANALRLYPDTREFELTEVSGMVQFGGKLL